MNFSTNPLKVEKDSMEVAPSNSFVNTVIQEYIEYFKKEVQKNEEGRGEKLYKDLVSPNEKFLSVRNNYDTLIKDKKYTSHNEVDHMNVTFPEYIKIKEEMSPELQERVSVVNKAISNLFTYIDNPENLAKDKINNNGDFKNAIILLSESLLPNLEHYFEEPDEPSEVREDRRAFTETLLRRLGSYFVIPDARYDNFDFNGFKEIILKSVDYVEGVSKKFPSPPPMATR